MVTSRSKTLKDITRLGQRTPSGAKGYSSRTSFCRLVWLIPQALTATPRASYRSGASEGVVGGDCIYAIKFVFKCHETATTDTVLLSPRVAVAELVPLITGPINEHFVKIVTIVKGRNFVFFLSLSRVFCFSHKWKWNWILLSSPVQYFISTAVNGYLLLKYIWDFTHFALLIVDRHCC